MTGGAATGEGVAKGVADAVVGAGDGVAFEVDAGFGLLAIC